MTEHPAVAHLLAAHEQAERLARLAPSDADGTPCHWRVTGDQHGESSNWRGIVTDPSGWEVIDEDVDGDFVRHAVLHDPASVLRRIEAERRILAGCQEALERGVEYITGTFLVQDVIAALAAGWGWEAEHG